MGWPNSLFGFLYTLTEYWPIQYFGLYEPSGLYCSYSGLLEAAWKQSQKTDIQNEWAWQCFKKTLFTKTYNWPSSRSSPSPGLNDYLYLLNFFSACCLLGSFHNKNYVCSLKVMFAHKNTEWRKSLGLWSQTGMGSRTAVWLRPSDLPSQGISSVPCKMEMMTVLTP